MQAIILAAGRGTRMLDMTNDIPKCMLKIGNQMIIDHIMQSLFVANINNVIVIVGYKAQVLIKYLTETYSNLHIDFINENELEYHPHNNIYSLSLASSYLRKDDTILIESDIVYPISTIQQLINHKDQNVAVVSQYKEYMDGTVYSINQGLIHDITSTKKQNCTNLYKSVNIYKFSKGFLNNFYLPALTQHIEKNGIMDYYEDVFYELFKHIYLGAMIINYDHWYEIDTPEDYNIAQIMFTKGEEKYKQLSQRYGGNWLIPGLIDCCYISNLFFPKEQILNNLSLNLNQIITSYPIGSITDIQRASRLLDIKEEYLYVGNGGGEIISLLSKIVKGSVAITLPTYNEYLSGNIIDHYENFIDADHLCDWNILITPNNPTGQIITWEQMQNILNKAQENNKYVIVDESFTDFMDTECYYTLFNNQILEQYNNLVVLKSLGKNYGINGVKLGVMATSNTAIMHAIHRLSFSWNINGVAQYILSQLPYYKNEYNDACQMVIAERHRMEQFISNIPGYTVIPTQTDFILLKLDSNQISHKLCVDMLNIYNIYIKDLSTKQYCDPGLVRIAINDIETNNYVLECLQQYQQNQKVKTDLSTAV